MAVNTIQNLGSTQSMGTAGTAGTAGTTGMTTGTAGTTAMYPGGMTGPTVAVNSMAKARGRTRIGGRGGSQAEIMFQPWLTLFGASATEGTVQSASGWLDGSPTKYTLLVSLLEAVNCELSVETSIDVAGPWRIVDSAFTTSTVTTLTVTSEDSDTTKTFDRYLRWKVEPTNTTWSICFQLKALPSGNVPAVSARRRA